MSQPDWECIGQLGDANPVEYGGLWVLRDKTGVYCEEAELLIVPDDDTDWAADRKCVIYRFILERCHWTPKLFDMGVLSDNKFHLDHAAWWAEPEGNKVLRPQDSTYLSNLCSFTGIEGPDLIEMFCSADALQRAQAYRIVGEYHGFDNLDHDPLTLPRWQARRRYETRRGNPKPQYKVVK